MAKYIIVFLLSSATLIAQTHTKLAVVLFTYGGNPLQFSTTAVQRAQQQFKLDQKWWAETSYGNRIIDWDGTVLGPFTIQRPLMDNLGRLIPLTTCLDGTYTTWPNPYKMSFYSQEFIDWSKSVVPSGTNMVHFVSPCGSEPPLARVFSNNQEWYIHRNQKYPYTLYNWGYFWGLPLTYVLHCTVNGIPVPYSNNCTVRNNLGNMGDDPFQIGNYYHTPAFAKVNQGWIPASLHKIITSSGTFQIKPLELLATDGIMLLTIQIADGFIPRTYNVEYRIPIGLDNGMGKSGVFVRAATNLIDMAPLTYKGFDQMLVLNQPLNLLPKGTITLTASDNTSATVNVVIQ